MKGRAARLILVHVPAGALIVSAILALAAARSAETTLSAGESADLGSLARSLGGGPPPGASFILESFAVAGPDGSADYRSRVAYGTKGAEARAEIAVNRPLRAWGWEFHQKAWNVGVARVRVETGGGARDFKDRLELKEGDGGRVLVRVAGYDGGLLYRWSALDANGVERAAGTGGSEALSASLGAAGRPFRVVEEDFRLFSVIEARCKPLNGLVAAMAAICLASMAALGAIRALNRARSAAHAAFRGARPVDGARDAPPAEGR